MCTAQTCRTNIAMLWPPPPKKKPTHQHADYMLVCVHCMCAFLRVARCVYDYMGVSFWMWSCVRFRNRRQSKRALSSILRAPLSASVWLFVISGPKQKSRYDFGYASTMPSIWWRCHRAHSIDCRSVLPPELDQECIYTCKYAQCQSIKMPSLGRK